MVKKGSLGHLYGEYRLLQIVLISSAAAVAALAGYLLYFVSPVFSDMVYKDAEQEAVEVATHLSTMLTRDLGGKKLTAENIPPGFVAELLEARQQFQLKKITVVSADAEVLVSTDGDDVGAIIGGEKFFQVISAGVVRTEVLAAGAGSVNGSVVQTFVPVGKDGEIVGAMEIFLDITARKGKLDRLLATNYLVLVFLGTGLLLVIAFIIARAKRNILARKEAEEKIFQQNEDLREKNGELSVLFDVSRVISHTRDMEELLSDILKTVVNRLEIFKVEHKGGIFIVDGRRMELVCHLGHPSVFLEQHKNMTVDTCLCGLAARTGEIVISGNSDHDKHHTIRYEGMAPHGHIIVPLKVAERVVGVLYLYTGADVKIGEHMKGLLLGIGNQVGIAIENARHYEEIKRLSLHDPLTGVANRRLMEITLEQSVSSAERYEKTLSVAMFDIDFFKKYNDTHGHAAGDELLAKVARILKNQVRESDLVCRYGGEEFLVILLEASARNGCVVAERIREEVETASGVTISAGVSAFRAGLSWKELVEEADQALYKAKEHGRNRVECAVSLDDCKCSKEKSPEE
ncbi:MAG: sensor domain-containing diguanylate cyclase [Desulfobacterales bacterium]|nr:sensor domain-containing diguanylate cyclase [Desulfobacterales bacterium]